MNTIPEYSANFIIFITFNTVNAYSVIWMSVTFLLLVFSGLLTASEFAFISLNQKDIENLKDKNNKISRLIQKYSESKEILHTTILSTYIIVNTSLILLLIYLASALLNFDNLNSEIIFEILTITFCVLFFGRFIPKIFADKNHLKILKITILPLHFAGIILKPVNKLIIRLNSNLKKSILKKQNISIEDLSNAIEIASSNNEQNIDILQGIVKFGSIDVKEIMTPRLDVISFDIKTSFSELKKNIIEYEYSRIPVYEDSFDNIKGILYIKDLIKYINFEDFDWTSLVREPYFVPETKKIDDLLQEFKSKKIHIAIVSDEYGGIIGVISLEDILEEIIGEINDEFDVEENFFKKIDNNTFIFAGKTQLNDFYKIFETVDNLFDDVKGDAETIAGLILELRGGFPTVGEIINCHNFVFQIESVDNRKINTIKVIKKQKNI